MSLVSDIIGILVLISLFLVASMVIVNQNTTFLQNTAQNSYAQFQQSKMSRDFEAILRVGEPVSQKNV
ncbi:MAG: hypothetical protein Q7R47_02760, partial [Candidatus Diapherotrites archaeon]|nr:hypothetical protein [Candidatus Diapherotrites archaeon]